jgi:hypothetical protein
MYFETAFPESSFAYNTSELVVPSTPIKTAASVLFHISITPWAKGELPVFTVSNSNSDYVPERDVDIAVRV